MCHLSVFESTCASCFVLQSRLTWARYESSATARWCTMWIARASRYTCKWCTVRTGARWHWFFCSNSTKVKLLQKKVSRERVRERERARVRAREKFSVCVRERDEKGEGERERERERERESARERRSEGERGRERGRERGKGFTSHPATTALTSGERRIAKKNGHFLSVCGKKDGILQPRKVACQMENIDVVAVHWESVSPTNTFFENKSPNPNRSAVPRIIFTRKDSSDCNLVDLWRSTNQN